MTIVAGSPDTRSHLHEQWSERGGMFRVLVVDDDPSCRRLLAELLTDEPAVDVVAECAGIEAGMAAVAEHNPDLLFLDIELPGDAGFTIFEKLDRRNMPVVVFTTTRVEYAVQAFDTEAVDYLVKPFQADRVRRGLVRARDFLLRRAVAPIVRREYRDRIAIRSPERIDFVRVADIDWAEGAENYVRLHVGAGSYLLRATMNGFAAELDPARFVRIHRSRVVNVERIAHLLPSFRGEFVVVLHDGTRLRTSSTYRDNLLRLV